MLVYHYHPDTGVFLNTSSEADPDPMEPGKFLIPANATRLGPPSPPNPKMQHAVFRGTKWVVEDIPRPPALHQNLKDFGYEPGDEQLKRLFKRLSIKEVLKGGVT